MAPLEISARALDGVGLVLVSVYPVEIECGPTLVTTSSRRSIYRIPAEVGNDRRTRDVSHSPPDRCSGTSIALGIGNSLRATFSNSFPTSVGAGSLLAFSIVDMVHLAHGEQTPTYLGY